MAEGGGIVASEEDDCCEVGFTKKTYLAMFLEGHGYFVQYPFGLQELSAMSDDQLDSIYMATISMLTTTNDHSTVWRLHGQIVGEMYSRTGQDAVANDLTYCLALATSRLARVNKCSALWLWLRKLAVLVVFHWSKMAPMELIRHVVRSMELHLANYSASFTLVWLVDVAGALEVDVQETTDLLRQSCRSTLGDVSLWKSLNHLLQGKSSRYSLVHYSQLCEHLQSVMGGLPDTILQASISSKMSISANSSPRASPQAISSHKHTAAGLSDLQWLLAVECTAQTPYLCVVSEENIFPAREMILSKMENIRHSETHKNYLDCLHNVLAKIEQIV